MGANPAECPPRHDRDARAFRRRSGRQRQRGCRRNLRQSLPSRSPTATRSGCWVRCRTRQFGKDDVFAQFKDIGIFLRLNESPWARIHAGLAQGLAAGDVDGNDRDDLIVAFPFGLRQRYDNGIWRKISDGVPQNVTTADLDRNGKDDVIGSFKGLGLLVRYNDGNGPWRKIGPSAQQVAAGGFD